MEDWNLIYAIFVEVLTDSLQGNYGKISRMGLYSVHYCDGSPHNRCRFPVLQKLFLGTAHCQHWNCPGVSGGLLTVSEIVHTYPRGLTLRVRGVLKNYNQFDSGFSEVCKTATINTIWSDLSIV